MPIVRSGFLFVWFLVWAASAQHNVLLIVADDMGVDLVAAYGEHPDPAHTPVIDSLAADGVLFRNAWGNPSCSPTRSTLLTGRYALHTGIGWAIGFGAFASEMPLSETTLAEALAPTHSTWAVGKWHLSSDTTPLVHPLLQGFDHHEGSPSNLIYPGESYFSFRKSIDGVQTMATKYASTDTVDDAIDFIRNQPAGRPWFMYLSFNAPHGPFHKPPPHLHSYSLPASVSGNVPIHARAAVEAMDTEIGRLFATVGSEVLDETLVVFVGDNGTDQGATTAPFVPSHAKGTVYEGGVNVPLIVRGPGVVAGAECAALVNVTDIYATVLDYLDVDHPANPDSRSLAPFLAQPELPSDRRWVYTEQFHAPGFGPYARWDQAVRGERYKLVRFHTASLLPTREELYDLLADPFETTNLLAGPLDAQHLSAYSSLSGAFDDFVGPWRELGKALAGSLGLPRLTGIGELHAGQPVSLQLANALPGANALLVIGLAVIDLPFRGGIVVPAPDVIVAGLVPDGAGAVVSTGTWPAAVPSDLLLYFQSWMLDPAGIQGVAASNALVAIAP